MSLEGEDKLTDQEVHFTYTAKKDEEALCQGDILKITDELSGILKEVHPYFLNEQYKYFMVLTQSCDLVRRKGKCKTQYLTLAAVKSYNDFLEDVFINGKYVQKINDVCLMDEKNKQQIFQLIERIYNNTESEYFFLFKEDKLQFPESMVAYLRLSITLKIEYYDSCLKAKIIELADEFKAKLGWLVGNLYSRVGTVDWEKIMNANQKKAMIEGDIKSKCVIATKEQLQSLKSIQDQDSITLESIDKLLSEMPQKSRYDKVMEIIETIISESIIDISQKNNLMRVIRSKMVLKTLIT